MKGTKNKTPDDQKKRSSHKVRGVSSDRPEGSLWWERFVKEVGLEPRVKEIEGVLDVESGGGQLYVTRMMLVIERGYAVCEIGDFRPV